MSQSDIEQSLNIVTYIDRYDKIWREFEFSILEKDNYRWIIMIGDIPSTMEHDNYREASAYGHGYIDGIIGR